MKVTVIGTGYVGLVTGACLSEMGNHVLCLDVDKRKIEILNSGGIPIHEPGLEEMVKRNAADGRLQFTTDIVAAVHHGTLQFIGVGTPPDEDGSADLQYVLAAARSIGQHMTDYKVIVDKSTVPVGTADRVRAAVQEELRERGVEHGLRRRQQPGVSQGRRRGRGLHAPRPHHRRAPMTSATTADAGDLRAVSAQPRQAAADGYLRSAELTKYAANAMLATRISFMNELARLAERVGADIELVRHGIGSDPRIGTHFLYAGTGYGGSCFPEGCQGAGPHRPRDGH
jgi:UDPglucose 6-dehydrogenase